MFAQTLNKTPVFIRCSTPRAKLRGDCEQLTSAKTKIGPPPFKAQADPERERLGPGGRPSADRPMSTELALGVESASRRSRLRCEKIMSDRHRSYKHHKATPDQHHHNENTRHKSMPKATQSEVAASRPKAFHRISCPLNSAEPRRPGRFLRFRRPWKLLGSNRPTVRTKSVQKHPARCRHKPAQH